MIQEAEGSLVGGAAWPPILHARYISLGLNLGDTSSATLLSLRVIRNVPAMTGVPDGSVAVVDLDVEYRSL